MSLHVYLMGQIPIQKPAGSGIFVREDGQTKEISLQEWNFKYPNRVPVRIEFFEGESESLELFSANITHNLAKIADKAGIYECIWRPDENGFELARQIIEPVSIGLSLLKSFPDHFIPLNPENGWGSYDTFVPWVECYLAAASRYPDAKIKVSR